MASEGVPTIRKISFSAHQVSVDWEDSLVTINHGDRSITMGPTSARATIQCLEKALEAHEKYMKDREKELK